jgi:hypothetical protein
MKGAHNNQPQRLKSFGESMTGVRAAWLSPQVHAQCPEASWRP